jgi:hypothetical protein
VDHTEPSAVVETDAAAPAPDPDLTPTPAVVGDAGEVAPAVPASVAEGAPGEATLDPTEATLDPTEEQQPDG